MNAETKKSTLSAVQLVQRAETLHQIAIDITSAVEFFAESQGKLRASMLEVAMLLRTTVNGVEVEASKLRYDEPRGVRHSLDVLALRLGDFADELEHPGETKYSPRQQQERR